MHNASPLFSGHDYANAHKPLIQILGFCFIAKHIRKYLYIRVIQAKRNYISENSMTEVTVQTENGKKVPTSFSVDWAEMGNSLHLCENITSLLLFRSSTLID